MKTCFKCGESLPVEAFYRHPMMTDGLLGKCKECTKKDAAEYAKTSSGKATAHRRYLKRKDTLFRKANIAVSNAIRDGKLTREPCEKCGDDKTHGHHDDYSRPLDVRWLCVKHHTEHHAS